MILNPVLHICLPSLNESESIPGFLQSIQKQSNQNFILYVCVNQPDEWWDDETKLAICEDNAKTLDILSQEKSLAIIIIDKSSRGKAWQAKKRGVGWARKIVMDKAAEAAADQDLIVSVDADTFYPKNYFQSLVDIFKTNPHIVAHSNPYEHPLSGKIAEDTAILRYEIYMRVYAINMLLIANPYAFSAIGSGMVTTAFQYKRVGGISPKHSGEDFYFIQRMQKVGRLSNYNDVKVYPQARFSDRVNFGTGPAMIKGDSGDWTSYPFYLPSLFAKVQETYQMFEHLFEEDVQTPMSDFLRILLKKDDIWKPLRKNFKQKKQFVRAAAELVDALRILQYLKEKHQEISGGDVLDLINNMEYFATFDDGVQCFMKEKHQNLLAFESMKELREVLMNMEYRLREKNNTVFL